MAKTAAMKLAELMVLKQDIDVVISYLGQKKIFQFQQNNFLHENSNFDGVNCSNKVFFDKLQQVRSWLGIEDLTELPENVQLPTEEDEKTVENIYSLVSILHKELIETEESKKRLTSTYNEAKAFADLNVSYTELEKLSFLSITVGRIESKFYDEIVFEIGQRGIVMPLGDDKTRILVAATKKTRFILDSVLKKYGFVKLDIPESYKGVPTELISSMEKDLVSNGVKLAQLQERKESFIETHKDIIKKLLGIFSVGMQVQQVKSALESTQLVYRITGWVSEKASNDLCLDLDDITQGRIAIRLFNPDEVPSVKEGREKVPVKLEHGKLVGSFERMIFSYGSPSYGTIDPTNLVAFFFTLLFGIMFGDAGQGLVFVLIGILLNCKCIKKLSNWYKFGSIFIAIGCSSFVMGLITGEFFANGDFLVPFSRFVTGLFGEPRNHILHLMPSSESITTLFYFFLFTIGVGFVINSVGLIVNVINQIIKKDYGKAFFGKIGLAGALFFWYIVFLVIRILLLKSTFYLWDGIFLGVFLLGIFFAHPLERLVDGHRPIFENGFGVSLIEGLVELLELVSSYLSNSVSFLRIGAFALAHAVFGFIIHTMTELTGGPFSLGGFLITFFGNVIVIVLEGMIVAIQAIRLQYYEFFSKFFLETGVEFIPFKFTYKSSL